MIDGHPILMSLLAIWVSITRLGTAIIRQVRDIVLDLDEPGTAERRGAVARNRAPRISLQSMRELERILQCRVEKRVLPSRRH